MKKDRKMKENFLKYFILSNIRVVEGNVTFDSKEKVKIIDLELSNGESYCSCDLNDLQTLYFILIRMWKENLTIKNIEYKTIKLPIKKIDDNKYEINILNEKYLVSFNNNNKRLIVEMINMENDKEKYKWEIKK